MISGGLLPNAISSGVTPPKVTIEFLVKDAILKSIPKVNGLHFGSALTPSRVSLTCCLKRRTAASALFGHGVCGPSNESNSLAVIESFKFCP